MADVTGRDAFIIAQALAIAIDVLAQEEDRQTSNRTDMQAILSSEPYRGHGRMVLFERLLKTAVARGFRPADGITPDDVLRWLDEHPAA